MAETAEHLVLVLGDLHIPHRKEELPAAFKDLLTPARVGHVLCLGNICDRDTTDFIRTLAPNSHFVRGDLDTGINELDFPDQKTVRIGQFAFHLVHGHQLVPWGDPAVLANLARQVDADVVVHGQTHQTQVWNDKTSGRLLINPGSATGAYSPFNTGVVPSFLLLSVKGSVCTVYVYEARGSDVRVTKSEFTKTR